MPSPSYKVIWEPQPKQAEFMTCPADEVGFGGARGGGKSDAVIGDWASHEALYGRDAIGMAFRRERTQLIELIERFKTVLRPVGYDWKEVDKTLVGPKGGRLRFAYLDRDADADAYQGSSFTRLYCEEMGTFPTEGPINKLSATLRSGNGVPCQMKSTCNPGGPGHNWVKARYHLDTHPQGYHPFKYEFKDPFTGKTVTKTRIFIPSRVTDNQFLGSDYVASLQMSGSEALVRAWLLGDWDIVEGAFFDKWRGDRNVCEPFEVPTHWLRFLSMDWGFASPASVGWWAVASEDTEVGPGLFLPRGGMVRYREWYVKDRLTAPELARGILEREKAAGESRSVDASVGYSTKSIAYGVLDPSAFAEDGGPSIAEQMARSGVIFRKADNKRVSLIKGRGAYGGWDQMRMRIAGEDESRPMIMCFSTCADSIRTIPVLQHDRDKPEDLDTSSEDHAADDWRYACMARPWARTLPNDPPGRIVQITAPGERPPENQVRLEDLWEWERQLNDRRIA